VWVQREVGTALAVASTGLVLIGAGALAAGTASAAKWLLVGRHAARDYPLWSTFVWRNELADTFVEMLAVPFFARAALGTWALNLWLRTLGAKIGRGVWCENLLAARLHTARAAPYPRQDRADPLR